MGVGEQLVETLLERVAVRETGEGVVLRVMSQPV